MRDLIRRLIPEYAHKPLILCGITQILAYLVTKNIILFDFVDLSIPLDHNIPMRPVWSLVYVLSYVFWVVGYIAIVRVSREHCRKLMCADLTGKIICAACFILLPTTIDRGEITGSGMFEWILSVVFFLDTPRNLFPSMHCMFSWLITRELIDIQEYSVGVKIAAAVFTVLVCFSTLFTRQHYIVDIFGGIGTAEISLWISRIFARRRKCEV